MTQAGGRLDKKLQEEFTRYAIERGKKFIVMYGQTEATARMSYLPWESAMGSWGSIGIPIPGGKFELVDEGNKRIEEPNRAGELVYYGENVTMGYAERKEDMAKGDERQGKLYTGDIARRDEKGLYYIQGRKKRFVKIFGNRINLDDVEEILREQFQESEFACVGEDDQLCVFTVCKNRESLPDIIPFLEKALQLNGRAFLLFPSDRMPKNETGKVLYGELKSIVKM